MSKVKFSIVTPRGHISVGKNGKAEVVWNPYFGSKITGMFSSVQVWIDATVLTLCDPYVPMDTSMLRKSGILFTMPGSGEVIYNTPYAKRWFYNQPLVDSLGRHYGPATFQGAPARGSDWVESMKQAGGVEALRRGVQREFQRQMRR